MKTLTVKLPDGTTDSRKSERAYTHAIIVVITEARRAFVLDAIEKTIAAQEVVIAAHAPLIERAEQVVAYATAQDRLAFLAEEVTEENPRLDRTTYAFTCARWLSRSYRNSVGTEDERRRGRVDSFGNFYGDTAVLNKRAADAALLATARGKVEAAAAMLTRAQQWHAKQSAQMTIGRAFVHGWSQSAKNAVKAEQTARDENPSAQIYTTTEIAVHVPKARISKSKQSA